MANHLTAVKHVQSDFFIADILDAMPKDDLASMEHPIFALKAGNTTQKRYERNGYTITISPNVYGQATIQDKDIWIYCISQLVEAINRGREDIGRTVRFTAYDFLVTTNRGTGGREYKLMGDALNRLSGTRIDTNIETAGHREKRGFGLIDSWAVIEKDDKTERMVAVEVTLPDWLFRSVKSMNVLTLSPDYFRLRKPIDRRIYELVRKHCGKQPKWEITIKNLYEKSGSTSTLKEFRRNVKSLAESNQLPDYRVKFDDKTDKMTFYSRASKGSQAQIKDLLTGLRSKK
jgi:plasmid replication initiation protein